MRRVLTALGRENGESYIDVFIKLIVAMMLLFMIINVPGPVIKYTKLSYMCRNVTRAIETTGELDSSVERLIATLGAATSLNPTISYSGLYNSGGAMRVQLRDRFTVTMDETHTIRMLDWSFGDPLVINVPLRVTSHGVGEVFFK